MWFMWMVSHDSYQHEPAKPNQNNNEIHKCNKHKLVAIRPIGLIDQFGFIGVFVACLVKWFEMFRCHRETTFTWYTQSDCLHIELKNCSEHSYSTAIIPSILRISRHYQILNSTSLFESCVCVWVFLFCLGKRYFVVCTRINVEMVDAFVHLVNGFFHSNILCDYESDANKNGKFV